MALYTPVIQDALLDGDEPKIYVALDTSMLWNTYCLIRLSVIYRGRAIPSDNLISTILLRPQFQHQS